MKKTTLLMMLIITLCSNVNAELNLASPFQDGMVLQRNKPISVWGTADPTDSVIVSINGVNALGQRIPKVSGKLSCPFCRLEGHTNLLPKAVLRQLR